MTHLLSNDGTLVLSSSLAAELGSAEAAIILQQVHYWLSKGSGKIIDGVRWIYNTYDDWLEQMPWLSKWKLRKVFYQLREEGLLKFIQPSDHGRDRTGYYSIDYEKLESPTGSHVCYTALASVENQQMQMWLFTHHIDTKTTSKNSANKNTPPISPQESREDLKYFLGIKSNDASLATFRAMMESLGSAIDKLIDNPSAAAPPPKPKPNPPKYSTDDPALAADTASLRRLSVVTGLSVETLRANVGLQNALKSYPNNFEGVLDYLETECKTFTPGIGFVVVALREGRKSARAGGATWKEWADEGFARGLIVYSVSEGNDILIGFKSGKTALWSQVSSLSWEDVAATYAK